MSKNTIIGVIVGVVVLFLVFVVLMSPTPDIEDPLPTEPVVSDDTEVPEDMIITRKLYFGIVLDGEERVEFVTRDFPVPTDDRETVLHKLLEGPTDYEKERGYTTAISEGTELNNFYVENGVAYADFSEELDASGAATVIMIRDQIEKTLLQFEDIKEVVISIEGETEEILQP